MLNSVQPAEQKLAAFDEMLKAEFPEALNKYHDINGTCAYFLGRAHGYGLKLTLQDIKNRINPPKISYPTEDLTPNGSMLRDMTLAWAITQYASPEMFLALTYRTLSNNFLKPSSQTTAYLKLARDVGLIVSLYYFPRVLSEQYKEYEEDYGSFATQLIAPSLVLLHYKGKDIAKKCFNTTSTLCQAAHEFCGEMYGYSENSP